MRMNDPNVYTKATVREVGVREFRAELRRWLEHARRGGEVVVTERGRPVARITGPGHRSKMEDLVESGAITLPARPKEAITGRGVKVRGSVSDTVIEQRR